MGHTHPEKQWVLADPLNRSDQVTLQRHLCVLSASEQHAVLRGEERRGEERRGEERRGEERRGEERRGEERRGGLTRLMLEAVRRPC